MNTYINKTNNIKYWIVTSDDHSIIHYGVLEPNNDLTTGQTNLEIFDDYSIWKNKIKDLGIVYEDEQSEEISDLDDYDNFFD